MLANTPPHSIGALTGRPRLGGLGLSAQPNLLSSHCDIIWELNRKVNKMKDLEV